MHDQVDKINNLLTDILEREQAILIDIELKGKPGSQTIKVFLDSENGITLDKCERISRQLSDLLEIEEVFAGNYRLEVSSPGIDRPLKNYQDFLRNLHRDVEIFLYHSESNRKLTGKIADVSSDALYLQIANEKIEIPISNIKYGKLTLPW